MAVTMALSDKQARFAEEYIVDLNATQAAIRSGYSERTSGSQGQRLLTNPKVAARIAELQAEISREIKLDAVAIAQRWADLALADPNELTSLIVGSCRHCHGENFQYQWIDEAEFLDAQEAYFALSDDARMAKRAPVMAGGYGYRWRRQPNPECPRCDGFGQTRAAFKDTTKLSPAAQALFAGVKETQHGLEIKMNDQSKALELLARHIGMFPSKVEHTGKGGGPIQTEDLTAVKTEEELIEQARKLGLDPGALGLGGGEETQE
ncbi:terminase small subunit [Cognatishimia sp.]|uniref:terminase small subunit n=1 Tax=Cognatishimia sp. TaxID=2211648 RepID=UPI003513E928|nr:terminase small subunit [Cognatishimia sp.]